MSLRVDALFQPITLGKLELKNRLAMAPMTRNRSPKGIPGDDVAAYYRRRAEADIGLIITEGTPPPHKAAVGYPNVPLFFGEEPLAGWKRVVDEVHAAGGKIFPQLWHVGSIRQAGINPGGDLPGYGPSAIVHPNHAKINPNKQAQPPHEMTQVDIDECVQAFATAAKSAQDLGFDGVEIHGAHGYLIDQFFWETTNQRTDKYGGSFENRLNFAIELIAATRAAVGPDYPICFRFSQWKQGDYNWKIAQNAEELDRFLTPLSHAGVDIFHASTRRFWEPEFEGSDLNLAGWTRKITGKPTITVGSVGLDTDFLTTFKGVTAKAAGIEQLVERLEKGEFDLVAVGRALLSDPAWASKVHEGRSDEIVDFNPACLAKLI
ncbi:MAG: NADH:flavin oxidoreductase [Chrysiogenetes bacterium]|nr:NADH:flavin oxidoreductase [Chrysiogenetes bacterium]